MISGKEIVKGGRQVDGARVAADEGGGAAGRRRAPPGAIFDISGTSDFVKLIGRDGKQLGSAQQPNFGWGFEPGQKANPTTLKSGKWAVGPDQVVIDAGTRRRSTTSSATRSAWPAEGPQRSMTVSASPGSGSVDSHRRRDVRHLRRADGPEPAEQEGPVRRHLRDAEVGRLARPRSPTRSSRCCRHRRRSRPATTPARPPPRRSTTGSRSSSTSCSRSPGSPCSSALRHLQHALDDGRAARARAGHAAHARRVAQAGVPLGAARGLHHRAGRRDRRPARSAC